MHKIRGRHANELFINIAREIWEHGRLTSPRGKETLELKHAFLTLENPKESIVTLPERDLDMDYLKGEMEWYLNGDYYVNEIGRHSKFWYGLQDDNGLVNSNYGKLALREGSHFDGSSQFEWCIERLKEDIDTRQAVINYNQPKHKVKGNKDFVCTMYQTFYNGYRGLDSFVSMRSNDVIYGLSYDLPWFTHLQEKMADELSMPVGEYNHHAVSLHAYKKHYSMIKKMANAGGKNE